MNNTYETSKFIYTFKEPIDKIYDFSIIYTTSTQNVIQSQKKNNSAEDYFVEPNNDAAVIRLLSSESHAPPAGSNNVMPLIGRQQSLQDQQSLQSQLGQQSQHQLSGDASHAPLAGLTQQQLHRQSSHPTSRFIGRQERPPLKLLYERHPSYEPTDINPFISRRVPYPTPRLDGIPYQTSRLDGISSNISPYRSYNINPFTNNRSRQSQQQLYESPNISIYGPSDIDPFIGRQSSSQQRLLGPMHINEIGVLNNFNFRNISRL